VKTTSSRPPPCARPSLRPLLRPLLTMVNRRIDLRRQPNRVGDSAPAFDGVRGISLTFVLAASVSCSSSHSTEPADGGTVIDASSANDGAPGDEADVGPTCEASTSLCLSECVDLASNPKHCGSCSTACPSSQQCFSGQCCPVPLGRGSCDVYPECGCSQSQNCARVDAGPEECVSNGGIPPLGNCLSTQDCQHGLTCAEGVCKPLCDSNLLICQMNYVCLLQVLEQNGQSVWAGYDVCEPHCSPVFPVQTDSSHAGCGNAQTCVLTFDSAQSQWFTYCLNSTGSGLQGEPCTYDNDCAAGYTCITWTTVSKPSTCQQYCRIGLSDCRTGSCVAFSTPAYDTNGTFNQQLGFCE
jgi:hypothetical protein